ncbi:cytochrome c [Vibrio lamellibrachiae]|uniref:c-type cytochrome n=1 Tax=Vibrio lamellibrachiae TaxID=2910253 RepID=UPI003D100ACF
MKKTVVTTKTMMHVLLAVVLVIPIVALASGFEKQIDDRQNAFSQIERELKSAKNVIDGSNTDWFELNERSQALQSYGDTLHASFSVGSQNGSKAKQEVWDNPKKFNSLLSQMTSSFEALERASESKDVAKANSALKSANGTCRSCHRAYRARW